MGDSATAVEENRLIVGDVTARVGGLKCDAILADERIKRRIRFEKAGIYLKRL